MLEFIRLNRGYFKSKIFCGEVTLRKKERFLRIKKFDFFTIMLTAHEFKVYVTFARSLKNIVLRLLLQWYLGIFRNEIEESIKVDWFAIILTIHVLKVYVTFVKSLKHLVFEATGSIISRYFVGYEIITWSRTTRY